MHGGVRGRRLITASYSIFISSPKDRYYFFPFFCKFNFEIRFTLELQSYQTNKFIIKYFLCDIILMIRETEGREERSKVAGIALGLFSVKREEGT